MPRRTHPRPRRKHSRAHTRHQRERYIARRWRQAKDRYGDQFLLSSRIAGGPGPVTVEDVRIRHLLRIVGHVLTMHPEEVRRLPWWVRRRHDFSPAAPLGEADGVAAGPREAGVDFVLRLVARRVSVPTVAPA
jgi:hypothetical protein